MSLNLSTEALTRFRQVSETLLAPLDHPDSETWCAAVLNRTEALFRADRSMMVVPREDRMLFCSETLSHEFLAAFRSMPRQVMPGAMRVQAPEVDNVLEARRSATLEVWTNGLLHRLVGLPIERTPFYQEIMVPAGVVHGRGLATALPRGEAWLSLAHSDPADDPFDEAEGLELLHMIVPAFKAGTGMLMRLGERREVLGGVCDELEHPLLIYSRQRGELHRNRALRELLEREPEKPRLLGVAVELAQAALETRETPTKTRPRPVRRGGSREVRTRAGRYRLEAILAPPALAAVGPTALVAVRPLSHALPAATALMASYGLTAREAEVTLWMARGASNQRVARELGISRHTVGTHAENIFRKLGIHTRKGLGLKLVQHTLRGSP